VISTVYIGSISGLVFSATDLRHLAGYTAQHLSVGIHNDPTLLGRSLVCIGGFVTVMIHYFLPLKHIKNTLTPSKRDTKVDPRN